MKTMRAVRAHTRGGWEQLVHEQVPQPRPGRGEVLVAVQAASVTSGELGWDATWTDSVDGTGQDRTPIIPSHEMSGVVAVVGEGVTGLSLGDEVYRLIPFTRDGAAAEYVAVPADVLAAKPVSVDHIHAAAVPLAGLTAWQALVDHAQLTAGQHVLVQGGAGGVGSFVVQIAGALGARVTATASAEDKAFVTELGATTVIDYTSQRFEDQVTDVDVVIDLVGGQTQARSWQVLRPGGTLVGIAAPPSPTEVKRHGAHGVFFIVTPDRGQLRELARLIDDHRLRPIVDRVVPLEQTRIAYQALEQEHPRGKIIIGVA